MSDNTKRTHPLPLFKISSTLTNTRHLFFHHSSLHIMSTSGFTEFVQPTTPPKSTTPSISSVPNNTPVDDTASQPLPPQLAIRSLPIEEDAISSINYKSVVEDPDSAPQGFILNELDSRHFYPIHVPNPLYEKWDKEPRSILAKCYDKDLQTGFYLFYSVY